MGTDHGRRGDTKTPPALSQIVEDVIETAKADVVTVRDVIRSVGDASFAPILLLPALAVATPLSGIPLFSSLMGITIMLVATQMLLRRDTLWLPEWVLRRNVKGRVVSTAFGHLRRPAAWLDKRTDDRLRLVIKRPFIFVPQLVCAMSGAVMPILEFVPFTSSILGLGVALLALGMLARDGLALLIGLIPYSLVGYLVVLAVP